jgi:hypothetical protein
MQAGFTSLKPVNTGQAAQSANTASVVPASTNVEKNYGKRSVHAYSLFGKYSSSIGAKNVIIRFIGVHSGTAQKYQKDINYKDQYAVSYKDLKMHKEIILPSDVSLSKVQMIVDGYKTITLKQADIDKLLSKDCNIVFEAAGITVKGAPVLVVNVYEYDDWKNGHATPKNSKLRKTAHMKTEKMVAVNKPKDLGKDIVAGAKDVGHWFKSI